MHTLDSDLKQLHLQLEPHEGVRDQGWNALDAVLHSHRCLHQALRSQDITRAHAIDCHQAEGFTEYFEAPGVVWRLRQGH